MNSDGSLDDGSGGPVDAQQDAASVATDGAPPAVAGQPDAVAPEVDGEPDVVAPVVGEEQAAGGTSDVVVAQVWHLAVVIGITFVLAVGGFVVLGNSTLGDGLSIGYPIALVGTAGGTANAARRVQLLARQPVVTQQHVPRVLAIAQTYLSPVIGATFALLLYLVFLGGMLQGEFFPEFACGQVEFTDYSQFATCNPTSNGDAAMLMVWGFAAGFAERFVPNVLDRFVTDD